MRNKIIIGKMISYTDKILSYSKNFNYDSFAENSLVVEACVFNLSQLGELTTKLDRSFTEKYPEIPWHQMRGLRNKIVRDYEGVNLVLVWEIISSDLPELKTKLMQI